VRGRSESVRVWELRGLGPPSPSEREVIARFEAAVDAQAAHRTEEAEAGFRAVLEAWPGDAPSQRYLDEVSGALG
jgi:adenylate cyclase